MLDLDFVKGLHMKKQFYKLRTLRFYIVYSFHWPKPAYWVLTSQIQAYYPMTTFLFARPTYFLNCISFGMSFEPSCHGLTPILPLFLFLPDFLRFILLYYKTRIGLARSPDHI